MLTLRPGCFIPGKETQYQLYTRLGCSQGRSGRVRKASPPPGHDPRPSSQLQVAILMELPRPVSARKPEVKKLQRFSLWVFMFWQSDSQENKNMNTHPHRYITCKIWSISSKLKEMRCYTTKQTYYPTRHYL